MRLLVQKMLRMLLLMIVSVLVLSLRTPLNTVAAQRDQKQVFRGNITYLDSERGSVTNSFSVKINSYTSEAELSRLMDALRQEGQEGMLRAVRKEKRGSILIGSGLQSRDLKAVWVSQTAEGRQITALAAEFGELVRRSGGDKFPFTYLVFSIKEGGDGKGNLFLTARLKIKGEKSLEVENSAINPARLYNIKQSGE